MQTFCKKTKENLETSQERIKCWYDQKATLVELQTKQKVWVMEPEESRTLQECWSWPFEVVEKKGEDTYLVDLTTPRNPLRAL